MRSRAHRQRGFSLLEAIVAMTLFATGALALYAWQAQSVDALQRIAERQRYVAAVEAALPLVEGINPIAEPDGRRTVADLDVRWTSTPIEPVKPGRTPIGGTSLFELGLFSVDVEVRRDGKRVADFNVRRVGYRQVATLEDP